MDLQIIFRPAAGWDAVRAAELPWTRSLLRQALPLSLVPAVAWPIGQISAGALDASPQAFVAAFLATALFSLATLLLAALSFYLIAPFFRVARHWDRSVAVAAYASTPVFVAGALLFVPILVIASVAAMLHGLVLAYLGLQRVLGCREQDAAAFVASSFVATMLLSMLLGGLCSAIGLL